jgi:hypothetical protein
MSMSFRSRWVQSMAVVLTVAAAWGSQGNRALAVRGGETVRFGPIGVAPDERPGRPSMGLRRADLQQTR